MPMLNCGLADLRVAGPGRIRRDGRPEAAIGGELFRRGPRLKKESRHCVRLRLPASRFDLGRWHGYRAWLNRRGLIFAFPPGLFAWLRARAFGEGSGSWCAAHKG